MVDIMSIIRKYGGSGADTGWANELEKIEERTIKKKSKEEEKARVSGGFSGSEEAY